MMNSKFVRSGSTEIYTESFGDPADPAILLIMGATASMLGWPDEFCQQLARRGRFVIRYDNRDTGQSTTRPLGVHDYRVSDMSDDAVAVLDGYGIERAHIIGMSLGGMIAQLTVLRRPERVLSVTAISSSPLLQGDKPLPDVHPKFLDFFMSNAELDWSDKAAVINYMVKRIELSTGPAHTFDEVPARRTTERDFERSIDYQAQMNHARFRLPLSAEELDMPNWRGGFGDISVPFLIIHGTDDLVLPYVHGTTLAAMVPGAKHVTLQGSGHELHEDDWDIIINALVEHTR